MPIDSDAYPLTPFSTRVREHFENDARLGQLGFRTEDESGSQTESFFSEPTQWSLILGQALYARIPKRRCRPSKICVITGCMATRMDAYCDIGGFDPEFDFLDVDVDYSMRMHRRGWNIAVDSPIRAFHVGGGTGQLQRNRVLLFYKSRWRLLRKHGLMWYPPDRASFYSRSPPVRTDGPQTRWRLPFSERRSSGRQSRWAASAGWLLSGKLSLNVISSAHQLR